MANIFPEYTVEGSVMIEKTLGNIAERILALDEASLNRLWEKYKAKLENFETTREWEKSAIIFFIINSVNVKNNLFNQQVINHFDKTSQNNKAPSSMPSHLKRVK